MEDIPYEEITIFITLLKTFKRNIHEPSRIESITYGKIPHN